MSNSINDKTQKKNKPRSNVSKISGDFGESFIAYLLTKAGINVVRADTVGFDLFAIDSEGKIFPKDKIVGISVKARISKDHKRFVPTIPLSPDKIISATNIWHIEPWVGIVAGSKGQRLDAFLFQFNDLDKLVGTGKREGAVAVSELWKKCDESCSDNIVKKLF